jgi:hypothetical protein
LNRANGAHKGSFAKFTKKVAGAHGEDLFKIEAHTKVFPEEAKFAEMKIQASDKDVVRRGLKYSNISPNHDFARACGSTLATYKVKHVKSNEGQRTASKGIPLFDSKDAPGLSSIEPNEVTML